MDWERTNKMLDSTIQMFNHKASDEEISKALNELSILVWKNT